MLVKAFFMPILSIFTIQILHLSLNWNDFETAVFGLGGF